MVNELGLLEKADQLKSEKPTTAASEPVTPTPEPKAAEPAAVAPAKPKKERRRRQMKGTTNMAISLPA